MESLTDRLASFIADRDVLSLFADLPVAAVSDGWVETDPGVSTAVEKAAAYLAGVRGAAPLARLLPGLMVIGAELVTPDEVTRRAYTVFSRQDIMTWADLSRLSVEEIRELRNIGDTTARSVLAAALLRLVALAVEGQDGHRPQLNLSASQRMGVPANLARTEASMPLGHLALPVLAILRWADSRGATTLEEVFQLNSQLQRLPPDITTQWEQACHLRIADLLGPRRPATPAALVNQALGELDERRRLIVAERLNPCTPATYDSLAHRLGLSRERVRQLETDARRRLRMIIELESYAPLRWHAADLRHRLGDMLPADSVELPEALAATTEDFPGDTRTTGGLLMMWLAGPYRRRRGWLTREGTSAYDIRQKVTSQLARGHAPDNAAVLDHHGIRPHAQQAWLHRYARSRPAAPRIDTDTG